MQAAKGFLISCAAAMDEEIYHCYTPSVIPIADNKLPDEIQFMPPGTHEILASKDGKPATVKVNVTAKTADVLKADLNAMLSAAQAGTGASPFLDFNHDDREASAWVKDLFWGGDDPKSGGVRAKIEWTKPGSEALLGKSYRQFSPNFRMNKAGEISGSTPNMGGLVNRPAFRGIQPFFAREANPSGDSNQQTTKENKMNKLHEALVACGLLSAMPTDEAAAVIQFNKNWDGIKAKLTQGETDAAAVKTHAGVVAAKQAELDLVKASATKLAESNADNILKQWVKDGVIAAKDEAGQKTWRELLVKDPANVALMEPIIKAKAAAGNGTDVTKTVVENKTGAENAAVKTGEHAFMVKAKEVETRDKCDKNQAIIVAARENPEMYDSYRKGLLYVEVPKQPGQTA